MNDEMTDEQVERARFTMRRRGWWAAIIVSLIGWAIIIAAIVNVVSCVRG